MPSWLCKIWRFFANLIGKIVDFIVEVLHAIVDMAVAAVGALAEAVFGSGLGSTLIWLAIGYVGYKLFIAKRDDDNRQPDLTTWGDSDES